MALIFHGVPKVNSSCLKLLPITNGCWLDARSSFTSDNENVLIFPSIKDALTNLKKITDHVIVSGGGEIYKSLIDQVDTLHISTIDIEPEGDVYFPEIPSNFRPVFTQDFASNINYSYQIWQKG